MATARTLTTRLPACAAVVTSGSVQPLVTRAIAEGAETLTASIDEAIAIAVQTKAIPAEIRALRETRTELLAAFDATLAVFVPGRSLKAVGKKVRDVIARLDPAGVLARRAKAIRTQTDVYLTPLADGMACLTAILPTERAHACLRVIDTHARDRATYDSTDPIGLRRTHALFDLVTRSARTTEVGSEAGVSRSDWVGAGVGVSRSDGEGLGRSGLARRLEGRSLRRPDRESPRRELRATTGSSEEPRSPDPTSHRAAATPSRPGLPVHLDVIMPLDAFLGLSDDNGHIPGVGAVPAHALRELLADAAYVKIRRILTDPHTGHALDLGVHRYQLTESEQARIALRDRTCRMLDCSAPAYRCECDHAVPYAVGGTTKTANLGLACKRHHQHKTHAGWQILDSQADGSCTWTSPLGRQYRHEAQPVLPMPAHELEPSTEPMDDPPSDPPPF